MKARTLVITLSCALGALSAILAALRENRIILTAEEYEAVMRERQVTGSKATPAGLLYERQATATIPARPEWFTGGPDDALVYWECLKCRAKNKPDWRWCGKCGIDTMSAEYVPFTFGQDRTYAEATAGLHRHAEHIRERQGEYADRWLMPQQRTIDVKPEDADLARKIVDNLKGDLP
jgi:hypothetical protein